MPDTDCSYSRRAIYSSLSKSSPCATCAGRWMKHCMMCGIHARAFSPNTSGRVGTSRQNSVCMPSLFRIISSSLRLRLHIRGSVGRNIIATP